MNKKEPQMEPADSSASQAEKETTTSVPNEMPTQEAVEVVSPSVEAPPVGAMGEMAPTLPVETVAVGGVSTWNNNKKVTALWSINQNRNSWAGIGGVGWRKLSNMSDTAVVALTMLCSHAREKNSVVNYREENGMIREIYVW